MRNGDRITRLLLTLIAIFLGILVCKSLWQQTPRAQAQVQKVLTQAEKAVTSTVKAVTPAAETGAQGLSALSNYNQNTLNGTDGSVYTYRTIPISTIVISSKDKVRTINVVDQASSFIVQFDDRIEVYRIDATNLTELAAQASAAQQTNQ